MGPVRLVGTPTEPIWFSVEDDYGQLELAIWTARKGLQLQPSGQHVIEGATYDESERRHRGHNR